MSEIVKKENEMVKVDQATMNTIMLKGDLSGLTDSQLTQYYVAFCQHVGLDAISKPFDILSLSGKKVLYCTRSGTQQLNMRHKISHAVTSREIQQGIFMVTCRASMLDGRFTDSIGAVPIAGKSGEALANLMMKAETKAKRRATLDIVGLGILDESEVDLIPGAKISAPDPVNGIVNKDEVSKAEEKPLDTMTLETFWKGKEVKAMFPNDIKAMTGFTPESMDACLAIRYKQGFDAYALQLKLAPEDISYQISEMTGEPSWDKLALPEMERCYEAIKTAYNKSKAVKK